MPIIEQDKHEGSLRQIDVRMDDGYRATAVFDPEQLDAPPMISSSGDPSRAEAVRRFVIAEVMQPLRNQKPPRNQWWQRFVDQNLRAAKLLLKGFWRLVPWLGSIDSALGRWPNISDALQPFFGRRRQPAQR